ncbi:MAG: hypothetical protein COW00_18700 [Bdellovibrio sp. CG12_big_fil_rev_8_21_14_0_65_39_13]|nr:MAG: hypothetical protein COW78_10705 [Bdellovibrio sp. CG22_combo_CG10-13_8_21_14_all_39_27]PIQ57846.1 MAG: hypothetical protein COW00_18700 [Bdellovibrio sp. CG12_big_fil_rev_8_21_14_0_65_39_13]PIR36121.1 MAG: hypothetical protein COV37_05085 [Bdellovibrio sp. CG11_big_fil_rev_8_21_14_0_20_39_38]PJB52472.1 MAG: hypothetical protein CO099_12465 [Bdellovibrio sp. CG_4_9_14_3_um_filter_39_7]
MGKSGQRRARRNEPFYKKIQRTTTPHIYLERELIRLEKLGNDARHLWADFQNYLAEEREKVLDQILDSLVLKATPDFLAENYSRIVGSKFSTTPLSSKGSYLSPPGGRFNFGQSISYHAYFPALYVASEYDVAFAERFHLKKGHLIENGLTTEDLSLRKPESFTHQRVNLKLDKVLDLRVQDAVNDFFEIIRHIKMPNIYSEQAKKLRMDMNIINTPELLYRSVLDPDYTQWDTWIDQPSPSQWFGHYVRLAGIQGVIYPSLRSDAGHNVAVFLDKFEDTESFVMLTDDCDFVKNDLRRVDAKNFSNFI